MSAFFDALDEYLGDSGSVEEIQVVARRLWFYDFQTGPLRLWDGQGLLITEDDEEWLGSATDTGNLHKTPTIKDGRDGSSGRYEFTLNIPDIPGQTAYESYEAIKAENDSVQGRSLVCYMAIFHRDEGLRPQTPYVYLKDFTMMSAVFNEKMSFNEGAMVRDYSVTIIARDGNTGRSNRPNRTYADTIQKEHARQLGVAVDKGSEYLAELANRTYTIP